jgi:hypothetical protein
MSEPKTVKTHNAQYVGDFTTFGDYPAIETTIASGSMYQAAWEREKAHKDRIRAVLRRYLQDEVMIQQMVAELYKAETA